MPVSQVPFAGISNPVNFRNRIINGDMQIDQRNAGASVTIGNESRYTLDRWQVYTTAASKMSIQQNAGSVTPPTNFKNYFGMTSLAATTVNSGDYYLNSQKIEGSNIYDLNYGTANATTCTLSFWVRSSLTGTFSGALTNSAQTRSYPFTYSISSANTWEYKTIVIPGDTSGTWLTTNGIGIWIIFSYGVGSTYRNTAGSWYASGLLGATGETQVIATNGATHYVTGIQFEASSQASGFEFIPIDVNLNRCLRYYQKFSQTENSYWIGNGFADVNTDCRMVLNYYPKRANPSGSFSGTLLLAPSSRTTTTMLFDSARKNTVLFYYNSFSASGSAGDGYAMVLNTSATYLELNSEL